MVEAFLDELRAIAPVSITLVCVIALLAVARRAVDHASRKTLEPHVRGQMVMLVLTLAGLLLIVVMLPIESSTRGQILSFLGILLSATIALSSTTFLGNAMAGLMLRAVGNFRPGDFVHVGDQFGRVSERGIFHVEIQTEDRDLTTLPNLHLVTNPVTVVRASGTIVSATISLGYDVARVRIEGLLKDAARDAGLREPFVHITDLGDFSVTYRVAGLLTEVKQILSVRSRLRAMMLDHLHGDGVEIVSPSFMNQRALDPSVPVIPPATRPDTSPESSAEAVVFDKAEEAASLEQLRDRFRECAEEVEQLTAALSASPDEAERARVEARIQVLGSRKKHLADLIQAREGARTKH